MKTAEEDVRALLSVIYDKTFKAWARKHNKKYTANEGEVREIYFNQQLPEHMLDPKTGNNKIIYQRNKVRTTKYTPLSFIPMNIFFQFTNIANSYFLFIIILGAFQIFGVQSPGMQAVPLIVIVVLTAFKDAFEDYRRAMADYEMNSSRVHKLEGLENCNVVEENISTWRKFKKACTRGLTGFARLFIKNNRHSTNDDGSINENQSLDLFTLRSNALSRTPTHASHPHSQSQTNSSYPLKFRSTQWKEVNVGDIVRIRKNEEIPSDAIILKTSSENNTCYIETKNLDGETNLKTKQAMEFSSEKINKLADISHLKFSVSTETPNKDLYSFHGVIHDEDIEGLKQSTSEAVTINNVLLRGSVLRNTSYAICIVIATGAETKIMLNSGITPTKKSRISRNLNYFVIINFLLLFVLCFVSGLINGLFYRKTDNSRAVFEFRPYAPTPAANGTLTFFVNLIMYQTLVPISLYITIEIIKTIHAFFIYSDVEMYYERLDFPCTPKSWGISDDLGQIEYIFSDKTGTLTQNVMEFKKCAVGVKSYGLAYTSAQEGLDKRRGDVDTHLKMKQVEQQIKHEFEDMCTTLEKTNPFFKAEEITFFSTDFVEKLSNKDGQVHDFVLALALCHSAVVEHENIEDLDDPSIIHYSAESPDEVSLVSFAKDMGVVFLGKEDGHYLIFDDGSEMKYKVLCVIPFSSARKRMSIVVETPEGKIMMYMKGADNVMLERSVKGEYDEEIKENLAEYSNEGLRTLCISHKELSKNEFEEWYGKYTTASKLIDEQREVQMDQLADEFEHGVKLIGATAIDDKLQDSVPQTIESLRKAGIKIWVLTGDKVETAISIGYSCSMLNNNMDLLRIEADTAEDLERMIDTYLIEKMGIENPNDPKHIKAAKKDHSIPSDTFALLVDGKSLSILFDECDENIQLKFLMLGKKCCSVLCCRVSPSQKADIVKLVKKNLDVITLAIGDGANDVSMIQAANVGIGIAGEEGRQAAMSSDYAFGQFKYLQRLLLVHGKWSFQRLTEMIPCFFYKNVVFVMPLFWYGIFTDFDGTYFYEYTFLMLFNLFFTSIPVITLATMDQDVPDYVSLVIPQLYRQGIKDHEMADMWRFFKYMTDGMYQSAISFFFPWLMFRTGGFVTHNGLSVSTVFAVGTFSIHIAIIACNLYIIMKQRRWESITVGLNILSNLLLFIWVCAWSSSTLSLSYYQLGLRNYENASFWACLFIGVLSCMIPGLMIDLIKINFFPDDTDRVRSLLKMSFFETRNPSKIEHELRVAKKIGGFDEDEEESEVDDPEKVSKNATDDSFNTSNV